MNESQVENVNCVKKKHPTRGADIAEVIEGNMYCIDFTLLRWNIKNL